MAEFCILKSEMEMKSEESGVGSTQVPNKNNFIKTSEKYNTGICIDVYQGEYNLCAAYEGQDEEIFLRWVFPQTKNRMASEKAIPHKITLGNKQQAIQRIEQLLLMVEQS